MKKRITNLIMLLIVGAVITSPLMAETLKIGGKTFDPTVSVSDMSVDGKTKGTIKYNATQKTLTFTDVTMTSTGNALYYEGDHITLQFKGKNYLKGGNHGIRLKTTSFSSICSDTGDRYGWQGPHSFVEVITENKGNDSGNFHAIFVEGSGRLTISGVYVKATAYSNALRGNGSNAFRALGAWVEAKSTNPDGKPALYNFSSCTIGDGSYLENGSFNSSTKRIEEGSTFLSQIRILPELTVGGVIVNKTEASNGNVVLYPNGQTGGQINVNLSENRVYFHQVTGTFGDVNLPAPYGQHLVYNAKIDGLNVKVSGTNTIKTNANVTDNNGYTTGGYGIYSDKDITIIGASDDYTKDVFTFTGDNGFTGSDNCRLMFKYLTVNVSGDSPITAFNQLSFSGCAVTATDKYGNEALYAPNKFLIYDCDISGGYYYNGHFYGKDGKTLSKAVIKKTKAEYDMYILGRKLTDVNIADFAAPGWKSGTLSYDYTPQRLILTDVEIDASSTNTDAYGIEFNKMELNFKGTSHIKTGNKPALYLKSNVTITSGENAKAYISSEKGAACEVIANRTLTLKAGYRSKFEFVGQEYGLLGASTSTLDMQVAGYEVSYRMFSWNENLPAFTVGKFVNESGNGFDFKDNGGAYTAAYWDASKKMPLRNGGECARAIDLVDIRSKYDASIGGKQFNDVNKYGMAAPFFYRKGDQQATYDQTTNTITLNNAYIDLFTAKNDAAYGIDFSSNGTLIVNGSNVVRTRKTATVLNAYRNLTITSATKDFKSTLELACDEGGVGIDLHYPNNNNNNWVSIQDRVYVKLSCFSAKKGIACAYWNLFCGTLKVDDATVDVISGGIGPLNSVSLTDCALLFPDGASFDTKQHAVVDANGDVLTTKLQIRSINDDVSPVYIEGIPINGEGYFPDGNFRRYVSANFDTNKNGYLSDSERNSVTFIDVQGLSIHRMTGIEWFPNLQSLYCSDNQIEELDVSKLEKLVVIYCHHNEINGENMDAFVNSLPVSDNGRLYVCDLDDVEGNYITPEQVAIAKGKHWSVRAQKDGKFVDFDGMTPGDVNLDKKVNVGDIMAVINTMSANKNASIADVNLDKKVNVGDIMAVINIMAKK